MTGVGCFYLIRGQLELENENSLARVRAALEAVDSDALVGFEDFVWTGLSARVAVDRGGTLTQGSVTADAFAAMCKHAQRGRLDVVALDLGVTLRAEVGFKQVREIYSDRPLRDGDGPIAGRVQYPGKWLGAVAKHGDRLALGGHATSSNGNDSDLLVFSLRDGAELERHAGLRDYVSALAFSPDGAYLAGGDTRGNLRVFRGGELALKHRLERDVRTIAWSPDGQHLAVANRTKRVQLFDSLAHSATLAHDDWASEVAFLDAGRIVTAGRVVLTLWVGQERRSQHACSAGIEDLAPSPEGDQVAVVAGREVLLWDGGEPRAFTVGDGFSWLAWIDPAHIALAGERAAVLRLSDGRGATTAKLKKRTFKAILLDARTLACVSGDGDGPLEVVELPDP
jgi:hypothetical protein